MKWSEEAKLQLLSSGYREEGIVRRSNLSPPKTSKPRLPRTYKTETWPRNDTIQSLRGGAFLVSDDEAIAFNLEIASHNAFGSWLRLTSVARNDTIQSLQGGSDFLPTKQSHHFVFVIFGGKLEKGVFVPVLIIESTTASK